mgnify:CR=1 FL=1
MFDISDRRVETAGAQRRDRHRPVPARHAHHRIQSRPARAPPAVGELGRQAVPVAELAGRDLCGYILKKDSPSCGFLRVRVYDHNDVPSKGGRGLFAEELVAAGGAVMLRQGALDPDELARVVSHLLDNAARHASERVVVGSISRSIPLSSARREKA